MKIETKFSNGETVYGIQKEYSGDSWLVIGPIVIGQVRVSITDSPGIEGEETFTNYMAQTDYKEQYMCVETGIGTGTLHDVNILFYNKQQAEQEAKKRNELEQRKTDLAG